MEVRKRFSIRHGIEAEPDNPIFEDAPERLRLFLLDAFQQSISSKDALKVVGRALCVPELFTYIDTVDLNNWREVRHRISHCQWWELYNLVEEMWTFLGIFGRASQQEFMKDLNRVFGEESIGWRMDGDGHLQRMLCYMFSRNHAFR